MDEKKCCKCCKFARADNSYQTTVAHISRRKYLEPTPCNCGNISVVATSRFKLTQRFPAKHKTSLTRVFGFVVVVFCLTGSDLFIYFHDLAMIGHSMAVNYNSQSLSLPDLRLSKEITS